jgi:hypothetical protein
MYATISPTKGSYDPLFLSLSNIYVRYPLSAIRDPLYRLTASSLIFNAPISFSL